jgi:nitrous oxide reductase accessory protein NosL
MESAMKPDLHCSAWPSKALACPLALTLALLLGAGGCGRESGGPPAIAAGTPCVSCGMKVEDVRWACERRDARGWRVYDSIECLLGDRTSAGPAWLTDWDGKRLHASDSLWVVKGDVPSPMGGGYAAFLDRTAAEDVAAARRGRVARLAEFSSVVKEEAR